MMDPERVQHGAGSPQTPPMGQARSLRIIIVHNADFPVTAGVAPRVDVADVANAARDLVAALEKSGVVAELRVLPDDPAALGQFVAALASDGPDMVFNLCESLGGHARHETVFPSLLELAGVPYTGSAPLGLGLALHKDVARRLLCAAGIPTPPGSAVSTIACDLELGWPLMVKPSREDASVGISARSVVANRAELEVQLGVMLAAHGAPILVERFIVGREIYVSLVGNAPDGPEAVGLHEMDFSKLPSGLPHIVCYKAKWDLDSAECLGTNSVPARLDDATRARLVDAARAAFLALGLRDYGRVDLRLDDSGQPYVIDVNPNCDLSNGAGMCRAASFDGLGYPELVRQILDTALARVARESRSHASGAPRVSCATPVVDVAAVSTPDGRGSDPGAGVAGRPVLASGRRGGARTGGRGAGQSRR